MTEIADDTLTYIDGRAGRLRLNRPRALHSLNLAMVQQMTGALLEWRDDPSVRLILIDHAEGRGFCAGGDVVSIAGSAQGHGAAGRAFLLSAASRNRIFLVTMARIWLAYRTAAMRYLVFRARRPE